MIHLLFLASIYLRFTVMQCFESKALVYEGLYAEKAKFPIDVGAYDLGAKRGALLADQAAEAAACAGDDHHSAIDGLIHLSFPGV